MSAAPPAALEARLQAASQAFQRIQAEMQQAVDSRQTLASQLSENMAVRKEFAALAPDAQVYKQMGPGLMKQEQAEARSNVEKRIEFIEAEIKRAETRLRELAEKGEKQKNELVELQTTLQAREQEAAAAEAGA